MSEGGPWSGFRDYVKQRLDRRYGLASDVEEIRRDIAGLRDRYATASEFDLVRNELNELMARLDVLPRSPRWYHHEQTREHASRDVRLEVFRSILAPMKPGRLLDLAAGHGKFAGVASELGWVVTAVDARTERFPEADDIDWVQSDLRDYEIGNFDVISLLGIFYHLELEDQLKLLTRCSGTMTIIDTHVALRAEVTEGGYEGRFFSENLEAPTASWITRRRSGQPKNPSFACCMRAAFEFVFKLIPPPTRVDRTWYICNSPKFPEERMGPRTDSLLPSADGLQASEVHA